jgi:hypothetical protein
MREIRPSGSEGGGFEFNRFSLPLSAVHGSLEAFQRHARPRQVTKNHRSDTTKRRRRDTAPIIEEPQTNAKNACVCATNQRRRNAISPRSAGDERQDRVRYPARD